MPIGASQIFVERLRDANALLTSAPGGGDFASNIFVDRAESALAILREEANPGRQASRIFTEMVRNAAEILGISIVAFLDQLFSTDLDGATEFLANTTNNPLGVANAWTLSTVWKMNTYATGQEIVQIPSAISGVDNFSQIALITGGTLGMDVTITDATGSPSADFLKSWRWNNVVASATWVNVAVKWDGDGIFLVINGVDQGAPDVKTVDDAIVMADTSRLVFLWADRASNPSDAGNFLYAALWDKVLTDAELLEAWNSGVAGSFNLGVNSGNYASAANLQHWWRTCADSLDIGKDSGIASTLIDVLVNAVDISAADCVADVPA